MPRLKLLKSFFCSKNKLRDIPENLADCTNLRILNIERNYLLFLPESFSRLFLLELRIGHNLIEFLPQFLFSGNLGKSLRLFSCVENNLLELPSSFIFLHPTCFIELDYNPYISPPSFLLSSGLTYLQKYLKIREIRKEIISQLLTEANFTIDPDAFYPIPSEVLINGTGFLTPGDLQSADRAFEEYLNGEYYLCPATAEEIVTRIAELRTYRETEMYLLIIRTFLSVVKNLEKKGVIIPEVEGNSEGVKPDYLVEYVEELEEKFLNKPSSGKQNLSSKNNTSSKNKKSKIVPSSCLFDGSSIMISQRPWGKDGEMCTTYVVSLSSLLQPFPFKLHPSIVSRRAYLASSDSDRTDNEIDEEEELDISEIPETRPSLFSLIQESLPPIPFPFTIGNLFIIIFLFIYI